MFNARRDGEPARLTLKEWKEAITDAWIDPNLVEKVDDPMEKHLLENLKLAYQSGKGSLDQVNPSENDKQITVDESDMPLNEREGKASEEVVQTDADCTIEVIQSGSQTRNIEKKSGRNYTKWKETESNLVKKHFKDYITDTTIPIMGGCQENMRY
ncbi:histone-lysine N-methyltransferase SETD8-A [Elysia marginata]|uniref:Histone-lysine N-methyltransferase SETD8-A n=1 Tax=Elysia marginata TaxID=1093978 RepID=A0AAV4IA08_9GAST|nr:histone-lysine N-methyltransferase SETD8-A [Elysia marginata]